MTLAEKDVYLSSMPRKSLSGTGRTSSKNVVVPDELWQRFIRACRERGGTTGTELRAFMEKYVNENRPRR